MKNEQSTDIREVSETGKNRERVFDRSTDGYIPVDRWRFISRPMKNDQWTDISEFWKTENPETYVFISRPTEDHQSTDGLGFC